MNLENCDLHNAARENRVDVASSVLGGGTDVNIRDKYGNTPLHSAAFCNSSDVAEILIKAGADVNLTDEITVPPYM